VTGAAGETGPKTPAFALAFEGGSKLVLTEAAKKKRAGASPSAQPSPSPSPSSAPIPCTEVP